MLLAQMQSYIQERRTVSLGDLEIRFGMSPAALQDALARLERKGRIRRLDASSACSGGCSGGNCGGCALAFVQWVS